MCYMKGKEELQDDRSRGKYLDKYIVKIRQ